MSDEGLRTGHLVAIAGAGLLLAALWLPWYEIHLGPLQREQLTGVAQQFGAPLAAFADGLLAQIDGQRVSAWTVFGGEDVALALGAVIVALGTLAAGGAAGTGVRVDAAAAVRLCVGGGVALGGLVLVKAADRPGPPNLLVIAPGLWVALAACAVIVLGGYLGGRPRAAPPAPAPLLEPPSAPPRHAATSVPPPPPSPRRRRAR